MNLKLGIYLETNFYYENGNLSCQDVYPKFLDLLAKKNNFKFNYLIKVVKFNNLFFNKIDRHDRVFILKSYKNLMFLIPFYIFYLPFFLKQIIKFIDELDCVIIMIPSPLSKKIFQIAKKRIKK